jgi:hypothetical protein
MFNNMSILAMSAEIVRCIHYNGGGEPSEGIGNSFGIGDPCPDSITSILSLDRAKLPAFNGTWGPQSTNGRFFMDKYFRSGRGKWSAIEVKRTVDVGLGGELWVDPGLSQQVESD